MQVRQVLVASLLAITAVGAMSQEIDRSETLQGKSLAAQSEQATSRESASAEAPAVKAAPDAKLAQAKTHPHGRLDLTRWHPARKPVVEAQG